MSSDLTEVINVAQLRLDWYSEYADSVGIPASSVLGIATIHSSPESAVQKVRKCFGWEQNLSSKTSDKVGYLAQAMENDGILVSKNSVVGNATRRPLNVEEFRGFTIIEKGYALVFVNTRDAKTAQLLAWPMNSHML